MSVSSNTITTEEAVLFRATNPALEKLEPECKVAAMERE